MAVRASSHAQGSVGKHESKLFWLETATLAVAKSYDAIETRRVLDSGTGWETDPIFGRDPSPAKQGLYQCRDLRGGNHPVLQDGPQQEEMASLDGQSMYRTQHCGAFPGWLSSSGNAASIAHHLRLARLLGLRHLAE